jgi:hypothetical protein
MRCAELASAAARALAAAALALLVGCGGGGGNSVETRCIGNCAGVTPGQAGPEVAVNQPQGANTTEVVVDAGPAAGFALGVANLPYVTVQVCAPGSRSNCATIDHVFLDSGSIGLRVLRSAVAGLNLPAASSGGGAVVECYPFVIGAVWGALAQADVLIGGEVASDVPVQIIDDRSTPQPAPTADCRKAAAGELLASVSSLQARAVLGVGMLRYDCGLGCEQGGSTGGTTLYYRCDAAGACQPLAVPADAQVQNPVTRFAVNNNGTVLVLPAVPETGASAARGRLVFGIGTQTNNQLPAAGTLLRVETDPSRANYLYLTTTVGTRTYTDSYIDSGSNGLFFEDATLPAACVGSGSGSGWYCPASAQPRSAVLSDGFGNRSTVNFTVTSADLLFSAPNTAFGTLSGGAGSAGANTFVWGLSFFFGRSVYTSIWGQALAINGPWYAF